jgi:preprotein translocase subunit SecY
MNSILQKIKVVFTDKTLRRRVLIVLAAIVVFRLLAAIPVPGIDANRLAAFLANNQFLGVLNIFSGGGLSNLSIIMLGVGPYITASIILQLMTMMISRLRSIFAISNVATASARAECACVFTTPVRSASFERSLL